MIKHNLKNKDDINFITYEYYLFRFCWWSAMTGSGPSISPVNSVLGHLFFIYDLISV
jgi:hypothetical protein